MGDCSFCERPSFTAGYAQPEMCEKHFDLALLAGQVLRTGPEVTVERLEQVYKRLPAEIKLKVSFTRTEIAGLLSQALAKGFDFAFHAGGARVSIGEGTHEYSD